VARKLECVPDDLTLRCGVSARVRVKTSDATANITITALGYDNSVASVAPVNGQTNEDGYLEVTITCGQRGACPGETTVTFDASGYDSDSLDVECEDYPAPAPPPAPSPAPTALVALVELPAHRVPKLLRSHFADWRKRSVLLVDPSHAKTDDPDRPGSTRSVTRGGGAET